MAEDLPCITSKAVKYSLKKLQEENSELKEANLMTRAEAEKLTCNLLMAELEHSRLEDAMDAELRSTRKEASDLRPETASPSPREDRLGKQAGPLQAKGGRLGVCEKGGRDQGGKP